MTYHNLVVGRFSEPGRAYFVTATTRKRVPLLVDWRTGRLVISEMKRLHDEEWVTSIACVVMPDHFHWLFGLGENFDLSRVMKLVKARSARRINQRLARSGTVWQEGFYDHAVRKEENLLEISRYIISNPLRTGIAVDLGQYPLWDATWMWDEEEIAGRL